MSVMQASNGYKLSCFLCPQSELLFLTFLFLFVLRGDDVTFPAVPGFSIVLVLEGEGALMDAAFKKGDIFCCRGEIPVTATSNCFLARCQQRS